MQKNHEETVADGVQPPLHVSNKIKSTTTCKIHYNKMRYSYPDLFYQDLVKM